MVQNKEYAYIAVHNLLVAMELLIVSNSLLKEIDGPHKLDDRYRAKGMELGPNIDEILDWITDSEGNIDEAITAIKETYYLIESEIDNQKGK